jgi:hypothetical protein
MRLATYNVEWFSNLFTDANKPDPSTEWSGRWNITRAAQLTALKSVFLAMDADAVMVIEAPDQSPSRDCITALERFADWAGLRTSRAVMGFQSHTQQEIALLYDPAVLTAHHDPRTSDAAPKFDTKFKRDLDVDDKPETVVWSKPPCELALTTAGGTALRLIGVHAKSKAPHGARDDADALRLSIANRRKQHAQCLWLRARVDADLAAGDDVIVLGDLNDGPGLDRFEELFGRSGVEIVLGADGPHPLYDPNALLPLRPGAAQASSARFFNRQSKRYFNALIDFVMVSDRLRPLTTWRILHPFDDPKCFGDAALRDALLTASDHFPVVVEIDI